jgi:hypothetical protein
MLIAVLPYGHAVPGVGDVDPPPVAAKVHDGRMALYWLLPKRTRTTWRVEPVDAGKVSAFCAAINEDAARRDSAPSHPPVVFVNHAAAGHYPPGIRPDESLVRFHDLCAWIGERGGDEAQVSFTGILLTFLVADDSISRWFQDYVGRRRIAVGDMLGSKGFATRAELEKIAAAHAPSSTVMNKRPWTPSAREVLTASDGLAQRVGGEGCAIGLRHVMGAYCYFHYPNHDAQLRRWGFVLDDWLAEYWTFLKTLDVLPAERAGWYALLREMGVLDRIETAASGVRNSVAQGATADAAPAGWDIFIAHAGADQTSAEQLHDRLEAGGHRVFLDTRTLRPGDFWDLEIPRALTTSRLVVIMVASSYEPAHYLRAEVAQAIDRARKTGAPRVVPVYIDGPLRSGMDAPYGLGIVQGIDVRAAGGLNAVATKLEQLLA